MLVYYVWSVNEQGEKVRCWAWANDVGHALILMSAVFTAAQGQVGGIPRLALFDSDETTIIAEVGKLSP